MAREFAMAEKAIVAINGKTITPLNASELSGYKLHQARGNSVLYISFHDGSAIEYINNRWVSRPPGNIPHTPIDTLIDDKIQTFEKRVEKKTSQKSYLGAVISIPALTLLFFWIDSTITRYTQIAVNEKSASIVSTYKTAYQGVFSSAADQISHALNDSAYAMFEATDAASKAQSATSQIDKSMQKASRSLTIAKDAVTEAARLKHSLDESAKRITELKRTYKSSVEEFNTTVDEIKKNAIKASDAKRSAETAAQELDEMKKAYADILKKSSDKFSDQNFVAIANIIMQSTQFSEILRTKLPKNECGKLPVGSVVAWPSDLNRDRVPDGWKICNGQELQANKFSELEKRLRGLYGTAREGFFRLPNYQGLFLRGVDNNRNDEFRDFDKFSRKSSGNLIGPVVGSIQKNAIADHRHHTPFTVVPPGGSNPGNNNNVARCTERHFNGVLITAEEPLRWNGTSFASEHSKESRPNNIYVYWIIKAR